MSCTRRGRGVKTEHLVARTFFSVLLCLARARLSTYQSRTHAWLKFAQVRLTCDVWSVLPVIHDFSFQLSFCSTPPQTTRTTRSQTGIRSTPCATPLDGRSGYLAESLPHTGYEPNTCIDVSSEHTPINHSSSWNRFNNENDLTTTVAASENFDGFHQQAAASGSSHFVPTREVNPWLSADPWPARSRKLLRGDVSNITSVEETCSEGKRNRDLENVQTLSEIKNCMSTSSIKLTWLLEKNAQLRDDYLQLKRTWK